MALPTMPDFVEAYRAFASRYAPGQDAESLEFNERLRHLLELAARYATDPAAPAPPPTPPTELGEMLRLNEGWIDRIKREEEMDGIVPWPARD
jgi:hypothetical protein